MYDLVLFCLMTILPYILTFTKSFLITSSNFPVTNIIIISIQTKTI